MHSLRRTATTLLHEAGVPAAEIGDFVAKDNPSAAERYVRRLRDRIEVLREFPEAGHRIRKRSNVRALVERPIIIVIPNEFVMLGEC